MNKQNDVKHSVTELEFLHAMDSLAKTRALCKFLKSSADDTHGPTTNPLDLKIDLEDFGPIDRGTIRLKPLTIFIGPNNSGKSYVSVLLHSILWASTNTLSGPEELDNNVVNDLVKQLQKTHKTHMAVPPTIITKIHDIYVKNFSKQVEEQLSYNFKSDPTQIIRIGKNSARITISTRNAVNITIENKVVAKSKITDKKFTIKLSNDMPSKLIQETKTETIINIAPNMKELIPYVLYSHLNSELPLLPGSHYLPAARSGILQAYKTMAASLVSVKSRAGDTFPTHTLTGTMADFVSDLITIPEQEGALAKIAKQMERDLFDGSIDLSKSRGKFPEMTYTSGGHQIPLHRASATVSEVAPISIYLKYIVNSGDLLVIEEPEAHLHPTNQSEMAKSIVKMIRAGLNVLITTHSAYLVERLGQYMVAGMADPKLRDKRQSYKDEYLSPDEVAPYLFKRYQDGYRVYEIEKNNEDGISQEEFISVLESLNNESITLQKELLKKSDADI